MRGGGHGSGHVLVLIGDVRHVHGLVHVNVVVDIGDLRFVDDGGVRDVDVGHICLAYAVRRAIHVTRSQGEPRNTCRRAANGHSNAPVRAANPCDERGRVDRAHVSHGNHRPRWTGHPTAVVEWGESPRSVVHPGPAPRRNPNPMAVAIRRPANDDRVREPNGSIFRNGAPAAIFIEIFIADHVIRNVARRSGTVGAAIAVEAPLIKIVRILKPLLDVGVQLIGSVEHAFFVCTDVISGTAPGDFSLTVANGDHGGVARFVHVDAVAARAKNGEREIRSVHFKVFIVAEPADANVQRALGQTDLHNLVGQIQKRKPSVVRKPDGGRAEMQFRARAIISPEFVTGGHRAVHHG